MSEPLLPLQTFGHFGGSKDDTSEVTAPFIGTKKNVKPSIWSRTGHALKTFFSGISHPSLELSILWIICSGLLVLHIFAVLRWPTGDYGLKVMRESFDCGSRGTAFLTFLITIPLNILATIVAYALGLVAKRSSLVLQVIAVLTIIPTHLLYNSLFFRSTSAYDAYEVLVSNDFLYHNETPFDLSTLQLRETASKYDPIQQNYNMSLPNVNNMTNFVLQLQKSLVSNQTQTQWLNLTFANCMKRYKAGTYEAFSNVILISNWSDPSNANNSALDVTILSGQTSPKHRTDQSLVSLCPESFFSKHNQTLPKKWKYVKSGSVGLFDQYAPKKFPIKHENIFVHSCYSQEVAQRCRLLMSPLVLKIATVCLMITVACLSISIFFGTEIRSLTIMPKEASFILGAGIVFIAFIIQFFLTAFGNVQREPKSTSDQAWLLNAFCIVNVVQLIDTICTDLFVSTHLNALIYFPFSFLWHVFLSGTFSMKLSDRYLIDASSPGGSVILPITNLSSLWFERMFYWITIIANLAPGFLGIVIVLGLFALPFYARFATQNALSEMLDSEYEDN